MACPTTEQSPPRKSDEHSSSLPVFADAKRAWRSLPVSPAVGANTASLPAKTAIVRHARRRNAARPGCRSAVRPACIESNAAGWKPCGTAGLRRCVTAITSRFAPADRESGYALRIRWPTTGTADHSAFTRLIAPMQRSEL